MSYRELRNFVEMMKTLGYRRLVSVENFRTPNFELVADLLYFLLHRYDPSAEVSNDISTEASRVAFLKSVAQIFMTKARVRLSIKRLYRADGYAVKELLKVARVLYASLHASTSSSSSSSGDAATSSATALATLKSARHLSSEIVDSGAKLFGLLGHEHELKPSRDRALQFLESMSLHLESNDANEQIERSIREQINTVTDDISALQQRTDGLEADTRTLQSKIDKKQTSLDRAEKRLRDLKRVKPAFLKEYEQHEHELADLYALYVERFRNLSYLESELEKYHEAETQRRVEGERARKRMQKRLQAEERRILRGDYTSTAKRRPPSAAVRRSRPQPQQSQPLNESSDDLFASESDLSD